MNASPPFMNDTSIFGKSVRGVFLHPSRGQKYHEMRYLLDALSGHSWKGDLHYAFYMLDLLETFAYDVCLFKTTSCRYLCCDNEYHECTEETH